MDINRDELAEAKKMIQDNGLKVSAIGSPIGKIRVDEPFGPHLDKFKHAIDLALFFETPFIRVFSYYAPEEKDINDYRDDVMERMFKKIELLKDVDLTMAHENERNIYGQTAQCCVDIVKTVNSPKLRLAYDPANFVANSNIVNNVQACWPLMKPYVVHIHIKDWKVDESTASIPGQGDGQIKELLAELAKMGYSGCMTMEPHLKKAGQFSGITKPELFSKAIAAVRALANEVGLKV